MDKILHVHGDRWYKDWTKKIFDCISPTLFFIVLALAGTISYADKYNLVCHDKTMWKQHRRRWKCKTWHFNWETQWAGLKCLIQMCANRERLKEINYSVKKCKGQDQEQAKLPSHELIHPLWFNLSLLFHQKRKDKNCGLKRLGLWANGCSFDLLTVRMNLWEKSESGTSPLIVNTTEETLWFTGWTRELPDKYLYWINPFFSI